MKTIRLILAIALTVIVLGGLFEQPRSEQFAPRVKASSNIYEDGSGVMYILWNYDYFSEPA